MEYSSKSHNDKPFGSQLLNYVARVLNKLPAIQPYSEDLTLALIAGWIRKQLRYLRETILLSLQTQSKYGQRNKKVSRNKLAYLWQHRRS